MLVLVSRYLRHYVTVAMAHGGAAVLVLSSVLMLTDCTCWLQPGVTAGDQWPVVTLRWCRPLATQPLLPSSTPSFRPALPLAPLCLPCQ